jgi:MinD-like ATPase involved in chromosome partitioning or flagellar assembly
MAEDVSCLPLISVHSFKGGVGKTSITALLGHALASKYKVCLVDLDLFAPGLHHLLRWNIGDRPTILDFLVGKPDKSGRAPDPTESPAPKDVCHRVEKEPTAWHSTGLYLIPGRPSLEQARWVQGYVLADLRCDLVKERLKWLFSEVKLAHEIDVFVLDMPPSLFGISRAARELVEEQRGLMVHVSTPIKQDLIGTFDMLSSVQRGNSEKSQGKGGRAKAAASSPPRAAQAFLLNRYAGKFPTRNDVKAICDAIATAFHGPKFSRPQSDLIANWLRHYEPAVLPEDPYIAGLSKVSEAKGGTPEDKITQSIKILGALAEPLMKRLTAGRSK